MLGRHRALDDALADHRSLAELESRDRGFARLLVATTLRRLGEIDALIDARLAHPLPPRALRARDVLRLGVTQLVFLGTPAHAAVDTAVSATSGRLASYRGLVNAVLRGIARDGVSPQGDPARLNTPDWLWDSWTDFFGAETARRIAEAHLTEPALDITARSDPASLAEALEAKVLPTGTLRRTGGGAITELAGYGEGGWWVQDAAAALPARLLGDVTGQRVADLCAAPGGKAAQLAAAGAHLTAIDISAKRVAQLRANLARLGLAAECRVGDARKLGNKERFDAILLDAPCSGTGTIRRHPDIARLKTPDDVTRLSSVQADMLDAAAAALTPGGVLVYAVCSLQKEEGPDQIEALLARHPTMSRQALRIGEVPTEFITAVGDLQTLPCHWPDDGGLDGFYAARLQRAGAAP